MVLWCLGKEYRKTLEKYTVCKNGFTSGTVVCVACRRCRRCDGTIQEADPTEDLMVDGETYGYVKSFCYLGDTLDGDGGADPAAIARIRNGWMTFLERIPVGRLIRTWLESLEVDMAELETDQKDVYDIKKWRRNVMKRKSKPIGKTDHKPIIIICIRY